MRAETAVRFVEHPFEAAERHRVVLGEQDTDCKPHAVFEQPVEQLQFIEGGDLGV